MKKTAIKQGKWYETKQGVGECLRAGGTFPWSAQIRITHPFPRGTLNFMPRDVLREIQAPAATPVASTEKVDEPGSEPVVLGVTATPQRKPGPHGAACDCDDRRFKISIEFDALVPDEYSARKIADMFNAVAMMIKTTGTPTRFTAGCYAREDTQAVKSEEHHRSTLDPSLN